MNRIRQTGLLACASALLWLFVGCGSGTPASSTGTQPTQPTGPTPPTQPAPTVTFTGKLFAGGVPVSGANLALYAAGSGGNGSAATSLLTSSVTTDNTGAFTINNGEYTCSSTNTQLYLVATGGNVGSASVSSAARWMAALGSCGTVTSSSTFSINEATTAAAVWALAPFMNGSTQVASTATNATGLQRAFALAAELVDPIKGTSPSTTLDASLVVESAKLYSLANVLASCTVPPGSQCSSLLSLATPAGGTAPTNTADAALQIVKQPGVQVSALYKLASVTPYAGLTAAPSDWTMTIETTGVAASPAGIAIDSSGKAWISGYSASVNAYQPTGVAAFPTAITGNGISNSYALAVDSADNVWVANTTGNSVSVFANNGSSMAAYSGLHTPYALAGDAKGNMWVANYGNSSVVELNASGSTIVGPLQGHTEFGDSVAIDASGTPWVGAQDGTLTHFSSSGSLLTHVSCCEYLVSVAIDPTGVIWAADYYLPGVYRISPTDGSVLSTTKGTGGLDTVNAIALDGAGNGWLTNFHNGTISKVLGTGGSAGIAASPASGYGLDKAMDGTFSLAVDASGCVWVTSFYDNRLVRFIGLAAPTRTPVTTQATAP